MALLKSLQEFLLAEDPDDFLDWRRAVCQLESPQGPFEQCRAGLQSVLKKASPQSRLERAAQTVAWRWTKSDVNDILQRMERMNMLISRALEMDHTQVQRAAAKRSMLINRRRLAAATHALKSQL